MPYATNLTSELINFGCSLVEGASLWFILTASFERAKKKSYVDIVVILLSGIFLWFLNLLVASVGTILTVLLQLFWAALSLRGKFGLKVICVLLWQTFIILAAGLVLGIAQAFHVTGDTSIVTAMHEDAFMRSVLAIIIDFLLVLMIMAYVYLQKHRRQESVPIYKFLIVLSALMICLQILVLGKPVSLENEYNFNTLTGIYILFLIEFLFAVTCILYIHLRRVNMAVYFYEKKLQKNKLEERHMQNIALLQKEISGQKAELLNYVQMIQNLLSAADYEELKNAETEMNILLQKQEYLLSGNTTIDIILNQKIEWARQEKIRFQTHIQTINSLGIEETDIVCLLSNLLDNACEAVCRLALSERYIYLEMKKQGDYLLIKTTNPYQQIIKDSKRGLRSTKKNYKLHGRGMGCMKSIAMKYDGTMQYHTENNLFTVKIMLKGESIK